MKQPSHKYVTNQSLPTQRNQKCESGEADMPADHYAVLGVSRTAAPEEIARAYHRLVRQYHPDTGSGGTHTGRLDEVVTAYAVLRDPERRAAYNHTLPPPPAPPPPPVSPFRPGPAIRVGPVRYHGPVQ